MTCVDHWSGSGQSGRCYYILNMFNLQNSHMRKLSLQTLQIRKVRLKKSKLFVSTPHSKLKSQFGWLNKLYPDLLNSRCTPSTWTLHCLPATASVVSVNTDHYDSKWSRSLKLHLYGRTAVYKKVCILSSWDETLLDAGAKNAFIDS